MPWLWQCSHLNLAESSGYEAKYPVAHALVGITYTYNPLVEMRSTWASRKQKSRDSKIDWNVAGYNLVFEIE